MTGPFGFTALAGLLGALAGLGVIVAGAGLTPRLRPAGHIGRSGRRPGRQHADRMWRRRLLAALAGGVLAGVTTRWPAAVPLGAAACWWGPGLLRGDRTHQEAVARVEAIAAWAESLRDTLAAASGLEQAIQSTAGLVPAAIAAPVRDLATRLRDGEPAPKALRGCADALADPVADLVIVALIAAAEGHARDLAGLLGALATTARDQAAMRLRVITARARIRSATRIIVVATLAMAAGLLVWARDFMTAYDTPTGQLMLLGIGGLVAVALTWLHAQSRIATPARILTARSLGAADGSGRGSPGQGSGADDMHRGSER